MLVAAVIVAVIGFLLKLISAETGGWFLVPLAGAACIYHVYVHAAAGGGSNAPPGRMAMLSNVCLLGAILLQVDFGGGNCGWDTLTGVAWRLGLSGDMGCILIRGVPAILLDIAFYIPAALTWWKLRAS